MNLKAHLASIGMTIKDFAQIVGVHKNYLSLIAQGRKHPGERLRQDIETLLGKVEFKEKPPKAAKKNDNQNVG